MTDLSGSGWVFHVNLPQKSVPGFCAALKDVMTIHRGGVFYFLRIEYDCTRCRYDWFLPYGREVYGLRLSLVFDTKYKDVEEVKVYLSLGLHLVGKSDIDITRTTERRILKGIQQVLAEMR